MPSVNRAEWNFSRKLIIVPRIAIPTEPPKLRSMLNNPDAEPTSEGATRPVVIEDKGIIKSGCPIARTI